MFLRFAFLFITHAVPIGLASTGVQLKHVLQRLPYLPLVGEVIPIILVRFGLQPFLLGPFRTTGLIKRGLWEGFKRIALVRFQ